MGPSSTCPKPNSARYTMAQPRTQHRRLRPRSREGGTSGARRAMGCHTVICGRTLRKNLSRICSGSGLVAKVTISQTKVVTAVLVKALLAKTTGFVPENGAIQRSETVMTKSVAMTEISLQALIRHQYQRSR